MIIAKRPCLEQSDNDEVDYVPLITHAEAKLQILDAILLNRDLTMQHILC